LGACVSITIPLFRCFLSFFRPFPDISECETIPFFAIRRLFFSLSSVHALSFHIFGRARRPVRRRSPLRRGLPTAVVTSFGKLTNWVHDSLPVDFTQPSLRFRVTHPSPNLPFPSTSRRYIRESHDLAFPPSRLLDNPSPLCMLRHVVGVAFASLDFVGFLFSITTPKFPPVVLPSLQFGFFPRFLLPLVTFPLAFLTQPLGNSSGCRVPLCL